MFRLFRKKPAPQPAATEFVPPQGVEEHLEILLRLCSFQFCSELRAYLYTQDDGEHRKGDVVLVYEERLHDMTFLVKSGVPELYDHLYRNPCFHSGAATDSSDHLKLCFHQPDCFLFSCSGEDLEKRLKKISSHYYVWDLWRISSPNRLRITCDELEHELRLYRLDQFCTYVRKHFYR